MSDDDEFREMLKSLVKSEKARDEETKPIYTKDMFGRDFENKSQNTWQEQLRLRINQERLDKIPHTQYGRGFSNTLDEKVNDILDEETEKDPPPIYLKKTE